MRICAALLLVAALAAGEAVGATGDVAAMAFRGVTAFPEAEVRRAIAGDLPLLLARRPEAPREAWLRALAEAVALGYRSDGFRDATATAAVVDGRVVLTVAEGPRTRCGAVELDLPGAYADAVRRALVEPTPKDEPGDFDTAPATEPAIWGEGRPVAWHVPQRPEERVRSALRGLGLIGGTIRCEVVVAGDRARLAVSLPTPPVPLLLGAVRVSGLGAGDAERLRRWLDLPADAPATRAIAEAVSARLRASAAFIESAAAWEDQAGGMPPVLLAAISLDDLDASLRQDAEASAKRLAGRGRADLHVAVRRVAGAPLPWEEADRVRAGILAARARWLERFAGGADLVADAATVGGGRLRLLWSARHGLAAIHRPAAGPPAALVLADGWLACDGPAGRLRAPMLAPEISGGIVPNQGEDRDEHPYSITLNVSGVAANPRLRLVLLPAGLVDLLLQPRKAERPAASWDGPVLVLTWPGDAAEVRCDPAAGLSLRVPVPGFDAIRIGLQDGAWAAEAAPILAGARQPERNPIGTVLAEALVALRATLPAGTADDGLARATLLARSGSLDALLDLLGGIATAQRRQEAYGIPVTQGRRPNLPVTQFMFASIAAYGEGLLCGRLADAAWPRLLLRTAAIVMCGDMRSAAAGLKPVLGGDAVGPIGCWTFAHAAQLVGNGTLAGLIAEAGAARCDADGLALEARTLAGLAPAILPALATSADVLAAVEADPARAAGLRALAAICAGPADPAVRLETAARHAARLGAGDWLRARLREVAAGQAP